MAKQHYNSQNQEYLRFARIPSFLTTPALPYLAKAITEGHSGNGSGPSNGYVIVDLTEFGSVEGVPYTGVLPQVRYRVNSREFKSHAAAIKEGSTSAKYRRFETKLSKYILNAPDVNSLNDRKSAVDDYLDLLKELSGLDTGDVKLLKDRLDIRVKLRQNSDIHPKLRVHLEGIVGKHPQWRRNLEGAVEYFHP